MPRFQVDYTEPPSPTVGPHRVLQVCRVTLQAGSSTGARRMVARELGAERIVAVRRVAQRTKKCRDTA